MVETALSTQRLRPRLILVWLVLFALIVGIVLLQRHDRTKSNQDEPSAGPRMLLPAPLAEIGLIEIAYNGAFHRFERDAAGAWFYHAHSPTGTGANTNHAHLTDAKLTPIIDKALKGFETARIERQFPAGPRDAEYGVNTPGVFILVYRQPTDPQPLMRYAVGNIAPDGVSRYVLPAGAPNVVSIADYQIENLLNLIKTVTAIIGQTPATNNAPR